MIGVASIKS